MKALLRIGIKGRVTWLAVIAVAALLIGIGTALAVSPPAGTPPLASSPTPTATPRPGSWPPPHIAEALATAQADPRAKDPRLKVTPPSPPPGAIQRPVPTPVAGINNSPYQTWSSPLEFTIRNSWQGPVGSDWVQVYAGGKRGPQPEGKIQQGVLRVYVMLTDARGYHSYKQIGDFAAPVGPDSLTITAVDGVIMRLRTDSGKTLSFNLQTRQYQ